MSTNRPVWFQGCDTTCFFFVKTWHTYHCEVWNTARQLSTVSSTLFQMTKNTHYRSFQRWIYVKTICKTELSVCLSNTLDFKDRLQTLSGELVYFKTSLRWTGYTVLYWNNISFDTCQQTVYLYNSHPNLVREWHPWQSSPHWYFFTLGYIHTHLRAQGCFQWFTCILKDKQLVYNQHFGWAVNGETTYANVFWHPALFFAQG